MQADQLKALQAPFKQRYREASEAALITLEAEGATDEGVVCSVQTGKALVEAGLHPATGGDGLHACSGDMLLEALVACAGVTLNAVATALEIPPSALQFFGQVDIDGETEVMTVTSRVSPARVCSPRNSPRRCDATATDGGSSQRRRALRGR